jgi:YggT family protein
MDKRSNEVAAEREQRSWARDPSPPAERAAAPDVGGRPSEQDGAGEPDGENSAVRELDRARAERGPVDYDPEDDREARAEDQHARTAERHAHQAERASRARKAAASRAEARTQRYERRRHVVDRARQVVDYVFYLLYGVLAIRFVLALFGAGETAGFVQFIHNLTNPFYAPFSGIVNDVALNGGRLDLGLIIALLAYMLLHVAVRGLLRLVAGEEPIGARR